MYPQLVALRSLTDTQAASTTARDRSKPSTMRMALLQSERSSVHEWQGRGCSLADAPSAPPNPPSPLTIHEGGGSPTNPNSRSSNLTRVARRTCPARGGHAGPNRA